MAKEDEKKSGKVVGKSEIGKKKKLGSFKGYIKKKRSFKKDGKPKNMRKKSVKRCNYRKSLKTGTIVILLSGAYKGKRCILLKKMSNGLLLITGPFKINGVPLRRVHHKYIIATKMRVEIKKEWKKTMYGILKNHRFGISKKDKKIQKKNKQAISDDSNIFMQQNNNNNQIIGNNNSNNLPQICKDFQDSVDNLILPIITQNKLLTQYLKTKFTLRNGMYPHQLKY